MNCHCCRSLMVQVRSQNNSSSRQEWHECPICHRVSMTSTPQRHVGPETTKQQLASSADSFRRAL